MQGENEKEFFHSIKILKYFLIKFDLFLIAKIFILFF